MKKNGFGRCIQKGLLWLSVSIMLLSALALNVVAESTDWLVYDFPIVEELTVSGDVSLVNQEGAVRIVNSTIGVLRIEQTSEIGALVVEIDAATVVTRIEVTGHVYLKLANDADVGAVQALANSAVYLDGDVNEVVAETGTYLQIMGNVDHLAVSGNVILDAMGNAVIEAASFTTEGTDRATMNIAYRGVVRSVTAQGNLTIGGFGYVDAVSADAQSNVIIDATITQADGSRTGVTASDSAQVGYDDDKLLVMTFEGLNGVVLSETADVPYTVVDVMGFPLDADVSVKSSNPVVVAASIEDGVIHLTRKAEGSALIFVTAKQDGYRDATAAFGVWENDDIMKALADEMAEAAKVVRLNIGNACNKSIHVGDTVGIRGVSAEKGATIVVQSSNPAIASVSAFMDGGFSIKGMTAGMTTVTITATKEEVDAQRLQGIQRILILVDDTATVRAQLTIDDFTIGDLTKEYDGNTAASLVPKSVNGIKDGDDIKLGVRAFYADANVGSGKTMFISFHVYGKNANQYLTPADIAATNAVITPRTIAVKAKAVERAYIADDATVALEGIKISGAIRDDDVRLNTSEAYGQMVDSIVGVDKAVVLKGISLTGAQSDNYKISLKETTVSITKQEVVEPDEPADAAGLTYTGAELRYAVVENPLYAVSGNLSTAKGNYTATISLVDPENYCWAGSDSQPLVRPWFIAAKELTTDAVDIAAINDLTYTGSTILPKPVVTDVARGVALIEGVDFEYSYAANTNVGTAIVSITGKGNYTGRLSATFEIVAKELTVDAVDIAAISDLTYTGSALQPKPAVIDVVRNVVLVEGVDCDYGYAANVNVGTATVSVTGKGNYTGSVNATFEIIPKALTADGIDIAAIDDLTYTGSALEPNPLITDMALNVMLIKGIAFEYSYAANTNVGTATVSITGKGNYSGSVSATFEIVPKELTTDGIDIAAINDLTYTGSTLVPKPVVTDVARGVVLVEGVDFDYRYAANTNVGTATLTVTGKGNYTGTIIAAFEITPKALTVAGTNIAGISDLTYTGSTLEPKPAITDVARSVALVEGVDFEYIYAANTNVGTAIVSITGKGNYTGRLSATFEIVAKELTVDAVDIAAISDLTYTGSALQPKPVVTDVARSVSLTEGVDFDYGYTANTNVGSTTVTVTGKGNYTGSINATFEIIQKELAADAIDIAAIDDLTYTGRALEPKPAITDVARSVALIEGADFDYSFTANTDVGTATVTITGRGNYSGSVSTTFEIIPKELTTDAIDIAVINDFTYTGSALQPKPVVTDVARGVVLVEGVDFDYSYISNVDAGIATLSITGKGGYTSSLGAEFVILPKCIQVTTVTVGSISNVTYAGSAYEPKPAVTDIVRSVALIEGVDFEYSYVANTDVGTATVTITGKGNYTDSVVRTFTIVGKDMTSATIVVTPTASVTYTGTALTPKPAVTDASRMTQLVEGTDYTYSYSNNTNSGTATITVNGKGNYVGSISSTFVIGAKSLRDGYIAGIPNMTYTGSAITPKPVITETDRNVVLIEGTDFTYAYSNNTNSGTATITITGKGNYTGSANATFVIIKGTPTLAFTNANSSASGSTLALIATSNSTGTISYSLVSGTTGTSLSGCTLTIGQIGTITVRASVAATAYFEAATVTMTIEVTGVAPRLTAVTATPGTSSASFDSNARTSVAINATYTNPSGSPVTVKYTIRRTSTTGSFVYTNGSSDTTARMAVGTYTVTAYAINEYGRDKKSTSVTVSPAASNTSNSGSSAGYAVSMTYTNPNPSYAITGFSFTFTTAYGHYGSDNWYVDVTYTGGSTSRIYSGIANSGISKSYSGLNLQNVSKIVFFYQVDLTHSALCLGTNVSYSVSQILPSNDNQDPELDNADEVEADIENPVIQMFYMDAETPEPTVEPIPEATLEPTAEPTPEVTLEPTAEPTPEVTLEPTTEPTPEVILEPTTEPTPEVILEPTTEPTPEVTPKPTTESVMQPTTKPTIELTTQPTREPTTEPTLMPTTSADY